MQVYYSLPYTVLSTVDPHMFLSFFPSQSVQSKQVTIAGLDHMFLSIITIQCAEVDKV
jgi:hypothetical protein